MNKTDMGFFGVLIGLCVLIGTVSAAPVSADINIQSGITEFFTCEIDSTDQIFPLAIGENTLSANVLHCSSNTGYQISAYDTGAGNKFVNVPGSEGKMVMTDLNTGGMTVALTNAFEVKFNGGSFVPLTAIDQILYSSGAGEQTEPLTYRQVISPFDPVPTVTTPLPTVYQIDIKVTCAPTP